MSTSPAGLAPGIYTGSVTLTSNAADNARVSVPVEMVVYAPGVPLILNGGIVNAATGASEAVAVGDIVALYGNQLAAGGTNAINAATPPGTTLGNTQVLVNDVPAPLYYVSPGQINFQIPYTITPGAQANRRLLPPRGDTGNGESATRRAIDTKDERLAPFWE